MTYLHQRAEHTEDNEGRASEAAEEHEDSEVHGHQRGADILIQLPLDDLVCHPVGVSGNMAC